MNFSDILIKTLKKRVEEKMLHMAISEISVNESREIGLIKINFDDNLINY